MTNKNNEPAPQIDAGSVRQDAGSVKQVSADELIAATDQLLQPGPEEGALTRLEATIAELRGMAKNEKGGYKESHPEEIFGHDGLAEVNVSFGSIRSFMGIATSNEQKTSFLPLVLKLNPTKGKLTSMEFAYKIGSDMRAWAETAAITPQERQRTTQLLDNYNAALQEIGQYESLVKSYFAQDTKQQSQDLRTLK